MSKHFEDFLLDISKIADDLQKFIKESAQKLNLEPISPAGNKGYDLDNDNQFYCATVGLTTVYLIAHKDVSIVYDFLQLSPSTVHNIERTRQFIANINPERILTSVLFNKIIIRSDTQIELFIMGNGNTIFSVIFTEGAVSISFGHNQGTSYFFDCYEALDFIVNTATNQTIPSFLEKIGFDSQDEHSPEVVNFINKTPEELFLEKDLHPLFNYLKPDDLMVLVCDDLKLNLNDVMSSLNYTEGDSFLNLYIPNNLTTMMSSMAQHIIKIDGIKPKLDQLFSLVVLYNSITNRETKFSVSFKPIQKSDFFKGATSDTSFYILNVGGKLTIKIGHNLVSNHMDDNVYIDDNDDVKFFIFAILNDIDDYEYKEYFTNDIDFVYNTLLIELQDMIKQVIHKDDNLISFKDLEVYKMAVV